LFGFITKPKADLLLGVLQAKKGKGRLRGNSTNRPEKTEGISIGQRKVIRNFTL
jgi:hypothetical protein